MDKAYHVDFQDSKYYVYTFQNYQDLNNTYNIYFINQDIVEVAIKLFSVLNDRLPINNDILDLITYAKVIIHKDSPNKGYFKNAFAGELVESIVISNFDGQNYDFSSNKDYKITMDDLYTFFRMYDKE